MELGILDGAQSLDHLGFGDGHTVSSRGFSRDFAVP